MRIRGIFQGGSVIPEVRVAVPDGTPVMLEFSPPEVPRKRRQPGSAKGILTVVSDDDAHLADFAEYMP
jgi:hypothetical protein